MIYVFPYFSLISFLSLIEDVAFHDKLAQEIERWRAEPGPGDIAMGGATLAAEAAEWGLIDEYGLRLHPVLVGGATAWRTDPGGVRLRLPATTAARRLREA